ncbi:Os05g0225301 [Oryza sativa Japonica Group]|uniref:Os05g0225301 protein n=1 Tax=Oryza sativa subsp. japonica TaxID=39947 RepID=A0A0P0WJT4_ORYSJ|nr:Os05g0225301 [Oryza sativa Japonica Group]
MVAVVRGKAIVAPPSLPPPPSPPFRCHPQLRMGKAARPAPPATLPSQPRRPPYSVSSCTTSSRRSSLLPATASTSPLLPPIVADFAKLIHGARD